MKKNNGLTLVEALIAVAIFAVFTLLINAIFFNILRGTTKQEAVREVKQNGDFAMNVMVGKIRNASAIDNCTQTQLDVVNPDGTTTRIQRLSNSRIRMDTTGASASQDYITSSSVTLPSFRFSCNTSGLRPLVGISYTMEHRNSQALDSRPEEGASMDFQTSVYMR